MERCSLCDGRMTKTEFGDRCINDNCENSKSITKKGVLCPSCSEELVFKRNNPYGDPIYVCPECRKEISV